MASDGAGPASAPAIETLAVGSIPCAIPSAPGGPPSAVPGVSPPLAAAAAAAALVGAFGGTGNGAEWRSDQSASPQHRRMKLIALPTSSTLVARARGKKLGTIDSRMAYLMSGAIR
jgi:hypothetical protein